MALVRSLALLSLAASGLARTDLQGCTYSDSVVVPSSFAPYNTRIWYVPGTGEICDLLDCGGGRAPPKTTVPGCPLYTGSETYSARFLDMAATAAAPVSAASSSAHVPVTTSSSANVVHTTATPTSMPRGEAESPSSPAPQTTKSSAAGPAPSGAAASTGDGGAKPPGSSTPISAATAGLVATRAVLVSALLAAVAAGMSLL